MNIDANEISKKSNGIAILYLLTFGFLGLHRFYVGKWKTGLICLLIGLQLPVIRILSWFGCNIFKSFVYQTILFLFLLAFLCHDLYAMSQEMFSDSKDKILLGYKNRDAVIGRTPDEKFFDKLNCSIAVLLFVIMIILLRVIYSLR